MEETNRNLDAVAEVALELQKGTRVRPLWGTAQLFKHPRYMHGAATSEPPRPPRIAYPIRLLGRLRGRARALLFFFERTRSAAPASSRPAAKRTTDRRQP